MSRNGAKVGDKPAGKTPAAVRTDEDGDVEMKMDAKKLEGTGSQAPPETRFLLEKKPFKGHYSAIYRARLAALRKHCVDQAIAAFDSESKDHPVICDKILEVKKRPCIVTGTLYKEMKKKPSVLDEYSKKGGAAPPPPPTGPASLVSDDDSFVIEDDFGRMKIASDSIPVKEYVSGVIVSLLGSDVKGDFRATQVFVAGIPPQVARPVLEKPRYVILVSGFNVRGPDDLGPVKFLAECVADRSKTYDIARVIVVGNLISNAPITSPEKQKMETKVDTKTETKGGKGVLPGGSRGERSSPLLDELLASLARAVPVDVMPGETDPANGMLPQQPFARCLFPKASNVTSFQRRSNPFQTDIGGITWLGSSGQLVSDVARSMAATSPAKVLEQTLNWRHMGPTCPDTLGCFPMQGPDPFVMTSCPHVYFAGNQPALETTLVRGLQGQVVRLICVPSFAKTKTAVLVNLASLAVSPLEFGGTGVPP